MNTRTIKVFTKFIKSAESIYKNPEKVKKVFEDVDGKMESNSPLEEIFVKSRLASRMVMDFVTGKYKRVPKRSIVIIIAAALYIASPIDAVFDYIPFIGYADDIFIFGLVYKQISKDLAEYLEWAKGRNIESKIDVKEDALEQDALDVEFTEIN